MRTTVALTLALSFLLPPKCLRKKSPEDEPLGGTQGAGFFGTDNATSIASADNNSAPDAAAIVSASAKPIGGPLAAKPVASVGAKDGGSAVAAATAGASGGTIGGAGQCIRAIKLQSFQASSPTCSLNEEVRNRPANLTFPCAGGAALASFGSQVFQGRVTGDVALLTNVSQFQFEGCPWESTQSVTGSLNNKTLTYHYSERLKSTEARCKNASPCTATGVVTVQ
jgi:hypothetical protein